MKLYIGLTLILASINTLTASNGKLRDEVKLNEIAMIGAHNAAVSQHYGWVYAQQKVSVKDQLEKYGVRFLKLPVHFFKPYGLDKTAVLSICHEGEGGNCRLSQLQRGGKQPDSLESIFKEIADFAIANPKEVVIVKIEAYFHIGDKVNGTQDITDLNSAVKMFDKVVQDSGMAPKVFKKRIGNRNWPSLGELRTPGQTILIFGNTGEAAAASEFMFDESKNWFRQPDWSVATCTKVNDPDDTKPFQVGLNPPASIEKGTVISGGVSVVSAVKTIAGQGPLSASGSETKSVDYAIVNSAQKAIDRLNECRAVGNTITGFILDTDYVNEGDFQKVADEYNAKFMPADQPMIPTVAPPPPPPKTIAQKAQGAAKSAAGKVTGFFGKLKNKITK